MGWTAIPVCKQSERVKREHLGDQAMPIKNFKSHMSVHLQEEHVATRNSISWIWIPTKTSLFFPHKCKEIPDQEFSETEIHIFITFLSNKFQEKASLTNRLLKGDSCDVSLSLWLYNNMSKRPPLFEEEDPVFSRSSCTLTLKRTRRYKFLFPWLKPFSWNCWMFD